MILAASLLFIRQNELHSQQQPYFINKPLDHRTTDRSKISLVSPMNWAKSTLVVKA
jgi:hypothetical protein